MKIYEYIDEKSGKISSEIINFRRILHKYPETANEEKITADFITKTLKEIGWNTKTNIYGHGVVATLKGEKESSNRKNQSCIAFRAEMDALELEEQTNASYSSKHECKMHACGHDNHMAILLGMAKILYEIRNYLEGSVKLIFEPAEETGEGAPALIKKGVLESPDVDFIISFAVDPYLPEKKFRLIEGVSMPRIDQFEIDIQGKASHGGNPQYGVDAIVLSAEIIMSLQRMVSRNFPPAKPILLNVHKIFGGNDVGTIPDKANIKGNIRSISKETTENALNLFTHTINKISDSYNAKSKIKTQKTFPFGYHDPNLTNLIYEVCCDLVNPNKVILEKNPDWGGDSFAFYTEHIDGVFVWFGVRNEKLNLVYPVHHPKFDVNDTILPLIVRLGCRIVVKKLMN